MAVDLDCWLKPTPTDKPKENTTWPAEQVVLLKKWTPETPPDLPIYLPQVLVVGDELAAGKQRAEQRPRRGHRYLRALAAGLLLAVGCYALTQSETHLGDLATHLRDATLRGAIYAAFSLAAKRRKSVGETERIIAKDVLDSALEGVVVALIGASFAVYLGC